MRAHLRGLLQHALDDAVPTLIGLTFAYLAYWIAGQWNPDAAIAAAPITAIAAWRTTRIALEAVYQRWPDLDVELDQLRHWLKASTDDEIAIEEAHWATERSIHTPKFATEHCPQCGTRAPARCPARRYAEHRYYAARSERRYREESARRSITFIQPRTSERNQGPGATSDAGGLASIHDTAGPGHASGDTTGPGDAFGDTTAGPAGHPSVDGEANT